ncbi:hypothetical protein AB1Y20_021043 [Prymnesium parvum]|uniref:Mono(ADP-ribosyl)transferase n=1 Tax=Prymnesium parvum TaxID=97485 RepID=A0AB34JKZ2_PRYPA
MPCMPEHFASPWRGPPAIRLGVAMRSMPFPEPRPRSTHERAKASCSWGKKLRPMPTATADAPGGGASAASFLAERRQPHVRVVNMGCALASPAEHRTPPHLAAARLAAARAARARAAAEPAADLRGTPLATPEGGGESLHPSLRASQALRRARAAATPPAPPASAGRANGAYPSPSLVRSASAATRLTAGGTPPPAVAAEGGGFASQWLIDATASSPSVRVNHAPFQWATALNVVAAILRLQRAYRGARNKRRRNMTQGVMFYAKAMLAVRREREAKARSTLRNKTSGQLLTEAGFRSAADPSSSGAPKGAVEGDKLLWNTAAWLEQLGIAKLVAQALLWPLSPEGSDAATPEEQLRYLRLIGSYDDPSTIKSLIAGAPKPLMDSIAEAVLHGARRLREVPVASGTELHEKYASSSFTLQYGSFPDSFEGGLAAMVGEPHPDLLRYMRIEHTESEDSRRAFTTTNFSIRTSSEIEWWFVSDPDAAPKPFTLELGGRSVQVDGWPEESAHIKRSDRRQAQSPKAFEAARRDCNQSLSVMGWAKLNEDEFLAARCYTGPLFMKYNTVLRGVADLHRSGKTGRMARLFQELCQGNRYTNTLHALSSSIVKLGKLTKCTRVYRGISNNVLPREFWEVDNYGVQGGVEFAFLSCSTEIHVALSYASAAAGRPGFVLEFQQGVISRGADLSWLSQYPGEAEVCFPPLTALEVRSVRVEDSILIIQMNPTVNQKAETLEKVVSRMQSSHIQLLDILREELRSHGAPHCSYERLERLRRRALGAEPSWFNRPAVYEEATNAALAARTEAFALLARQESWEGVGEAARLGRMRKVAELCARLEKHDVALAIILMLVRARDGGEEEWLAATAELLRGGLPAPWPATLSLLLTSAPPQLTSSPQLRALLSHTLDAEPPPFLPGGAVLAYHPKYRWLHAHVAEGEEEEEAADAGGAAWPSRAVTFVVGSQAVARELVLAVAHGGLAALLRELAAAGDSRLVALLLELRVNTFTCDDNANSALHVAASKGHASICAALIDAADIPAARDDVVAHLAAVPNAQGETPLRLAVQARAVDARRMLQPPEMDSLGALGAAARDGAAAALGAALDAEGASVDVCDGEGRSLLHLAAECGSTECLALLLDRRADVNLKDRVGRCALVHAAMYGHTDAVRTLLAAPGAAADVRTAKQETALHWAARNGHVKVVAELLNAGASVDARSSKQETPLLQACQYGQVGAVQLLLDSHANLAQLDNNGRSTLMLCCRDGHDRVLRELLSTPRAHLLLNLGTKPTGQDSDGLSALHFAARDGYSRCVRILTDAGAFVDLVDAKGRTPMYLAAANGRLSCVHALLRAGGRPDMPAADGSTPQSVVMHALSKAPAEADADAPRPTAPARSHSLSYLPFEELKSTLDEATRAPAPKGTLTRPLRLNASAFDTPHSLEVWLREHGIDTDAWGSAVGSKLVDDLWEELDSCSCSLSFDAKGAFRHTQVAIVRIFRRDSAGKIDGHRMLQRVNDNGVAARHSGSISVKMRSGEDAFTAARRGVIEELGSLVKEGMTIQLLEASLHVYVERNLSTSYPGLRCAYELHRVDAAVDSLPEEAFETTVTAEPEARQGGAPIQRISRFQWVEYVHEDEFEDLTGGAITPPVAQPDP